MSPVFYQPRGEDGNRERKKNEKRTVTVRVHGRLEPGHPRQEQRASWRQQATPWRVRSRKGGR